MYVSILRVLVVPCQSVWFLEQERIQCVAYQKCIDKLESALRCGDGDAAREFTKRAEALLRDPLEVELWQTLANSGKLWQT